MHPVWEKLADAVEKDFEREKPMLNVRRVPLLGLLVAVAAVAALCAAYSVVYDFIGASSPGAYCAYPDPYNR